MSPDQPCPPVSRRLWRGVGVLLVALALVVAALLVVRRRGLAKRKRELAEQEAQGPLVNAAAARKSPPRRSLTLIGEARPFAEVTLYAKVSGYLRRVRADKGDRVARGQLLAVIESPETDRDYQAALASARNLSSVARRYKPLLARNFVSQQEADQAFANAAVAEAQASSLRVIKGYEQLRAPFDGVVTARYADEGALVQNAQNGASGALPVFTISDADRLRVFVYVDQVDAPYVHVGDAATLSSVDRPALRVEGRVARLAGELDERTRTLLTEIDIDNSRRLFVPGSFLAATMTVQEPSFLVVPTEALVIKAGQPFLAVIGDDGTLDYRAVELGDNDGVNVQILSGLREGERVALNVGESITAGTRVRVASAAGGPSGFGAGGKDGQGPQAGEQQQRRQPQQQKQEKPMKKGPAP